MTKRLSDWELEYYEGTVANALRLQQIVKGLVYDIDDPDVLGKLVQMAEVSAKIRVDTIKHVNRRKKD